jgi:alcohol dehydrogenase (cytochrome c)
MTKITTWKYAAGALLIAASLGAHSQGLDPAQIVKPASNSWPVYSGDYSGRRFSSLTEINKSTVKGLSLVWAQRLEAGSRGAAGAMPTIIGGVGTAESTTVASVKGAILQIDGVLYVTTPDNAWALDAHDGHEIWHYFWKTRGGTHIGNRGMAMWKTWVYMETPDDYLICLDAKTGKEKWHKEISSFDLQYFSTMAPIVAGNHLIVGTSDDLDEPGLLKSIDPETGEVQWTLYTVPMKEGDPGLDTWGSLDAARHGGGNAWNDGSYDPETHLYIFGTGNPTGAYGEQSRGTGANLFTASLIAVNVDTGKMAWYYSMDPHDTHDFDASQTPMLIDGTIDGKPRKLVVTAERSGYVYTLDRVTGEHIVTGLLSPTINWAKGLDKNGAPIRNPEKDYVIAGALVSPANEGVVNWQPPAYSPQTQLAYFPTNDSYALYYKTTLDPRGAMGLGGGQETVLGSSAVNLTAVDYKTGKVVWEHRFPGVTYAANLTGLLTTAGGLVFGGDPNGNLIAFDATNGTPLWHSHIGTTNAPETYTLDGHQYLLEAGRDMIYAFRLN